VQRFREAPGKLNVLVGAALPAVERLKATTNATKPVSRRPSSPNRRREHEPRGVREELNDVQPLIIENSASIERKKKR
jgi:hypothetical protein